MFQAFNFVDAMEYFGIASDERISPLFEGGNGHEGSGGEGGIRTLDTD